MFGNTDGSVGILTTMWTGQPMNQLSGRERNFAFLKKVESDRGSHQPSYSIRTGRSFPPDVKWPERETDLYLAPGLRIKGTLFPLPHMPS